MSHPPPKGSIKPCSLPMPITIGRSPEPIETEPDSVLGETWGTYLNSFAWDRIVTLTFGDAVSLDKARREVGKWIRRLERNSQQSVPAFYAVERGGSGLRHVHALIAGTARLTIRQIEKAWKGGGFTEIERFDPTRRGAWYASKDLRGWCEWYDVTRRMPRKRST